MLAFCAAKVLHATRFLPATAPPTAEGYHSATGSAEGSASLSSLSSKPETRIRVQIMLVEVLSISLRRLQGSVAACGQGGDGTLQARAAHAALDGLAATFSSASSATDVRHVLRATRDVLLDLLKAARFRSAKKALLANIKAGVVAAWSAICDAVGALDASEHVLSLLPELDALLQVRCERALVRRDVIWGGFFSSLPTVPVHARFPFSPPKKNNNPSL